MENGWERTLPIIKVDDNIVKELFCDIEYPDNILNIQLLNEGCRTTNYLVSTINNKKYVLKIFFHEDENYKTQIKIYEKLREYVSMQKICSTGINSMDGRKYIIYEYVEGKTISENLRAGNKINKNIIRSVAHNLGKIHSIKFNIMGKLDENLQVKNKIISIINLYDKYINENVVMRLGNDVVNNIKAIVKENVEILENLKADPRLIHGDYQGTNIVIDDDNVSAIIDWELCMSGCPLMDIGQFFRYEEYFDMELINEFKNEYEKASDYLLIDEWYRISKILDLISLLQIIGRNEEMPNKYSDIKTIIEKFVFKD
ncbi:MAG: aminoglycoside phosphotransferase family protein [Clostridium butyricum]|nr:aminoglycoside phosphotransferase family protein [Clostridium butyricum]